MISWGQTQLIQGLVALLWLLACAEAGHSSHCSPKPPGLVDLGYAKHIPSYVNTTLGGKHLTVYKNIRFAKTPTGDLRFRKPDTRMSKMDGIQDGIYPFGRTDCIASCPPYAPYPGLNGTTWGHEDCLFLDVWVPEGVKPGDKLPVLHWVFGSGYAFASKDLSFSPIGLFDRMADNQKFIYVANNYRLGIPGWTSSPDQDMDANVGLHDVLAAGHWISKFIDRFGGDPSRVTAMGQSASAGILNLLTTLDEGKAELPFQQLFVSSPDVPPRRHTTAGRERLFEAVLNATDCADLACLRSVPEDVMLRANDYLINQIPAESGGGVFGPGSGFGPVPDGHSIPNMPLISFLKGRYNKKLKSMIVGNMINEGMGMANDEGMPENFPILVRQLIPRANDSTIANLQALYQPLSQPEQLAWDWTTDVFFQCNAYNLANAYSDRAKRYIMSVPPATHGLDGNHYFFISNDYTPVPNVSVALDFQDRLVSFVNGDLGGWPIYGAGKRLFDITTEGFEEQAFAENLRERCDAINAVLLDPRNGV